MFVQLLIGIFCDHLQPPSCQIHFLIVSRLVNVPLCRKGYFLTWGPWFSGVPPAATQDAQRVVINHTVTPRLLGLSATLAAWGLGTSGMSAYIGRGGGGSFVSGRQRTDVLPQSPNTPSYKHTNTLLTFKVPADTARTKVNTLTTWHVTLQGAENREKQCLGTAHQWQ